VRLDLDRHRTLGELIGQTFEVFGRHLATFLTLTLLVVAPVVILVDGGWGGALAAAVGAVALYTVAVAIGLLLVIVPGVWLAVRWYFGAQAAVVDGLGPADALWRSAQVVQTRWWRTFGVLLAFGIVTGVLAVVGGAIVNGIDDGALYTAGHVLLQAVFVSLSAIFGTLLFFDSRARSSLPWQGPPPGDWIAPEQPERPILPPRI
jgi:hypothetical protein